MNDLKLFPILVFCSSITSWCQNTAAMSTEKAIKQLQKEVFPKTLVNMAVQLDRLLMTSKAYLKVHDLKVKQCSLQLVFIPVNSKSTCKVASLLNALGLYGLSLNTN